MQRLPRGCINREIEIRSVTPRGLIRRGGASQNANCIVLYPFDLCNRKYNIGKKGEIIIIFLKLGEPYQLEYAFSASIFRSGTTVCVRPGRSGTMKRYIAVPPADRRDSCQNVVTMRF